VDAYTHENRAMGGYWSAQLTIKDTQENLEEWFSNGLGRHIEVYNHALERIWEGLVNQVDLSLGALSATRGPLLNIGNRTRLIYSNSAEAVTGTRAYTDWQNDTDSQALYGIITKILSAGGMTADNADQMNQTYIAENALPHTTERIGQGGGQQAMIHCAGYGQLLNSYVYNLSTDPPADITLLTKLERVLDGDPNGLFSSANTEFDDSNTLEITEKDDDNRTAWTIIKAIVAHGDQDDARWVFGIYDDQLAIYEPAETDLTYQLRLSDAGQRIEMLSGVLVRPWDIKPGKWLLLPDFLIGSTQPAELRKDPRNIYIETVKFIAPYQFEVQGGQTDTISQKLAKLGLAGIGA